MIHGSCHCGAVRLEARAAPKSVTECNCSICRRLATRWAYYRPDQVSVTGPTVAYAWGERRIAFHHCPSCGCTTHWQAVEPASATRLGVNTRLFDPADLEAVRVRRLDGADTWTYLD